jgi:hypothetical protein
MVDQVADLFRTTPKVKTQHVVKNRGQHCGDIELAGYLANESGLINNNFSFLDMEGGEKMVPETSRLLTSSLSLGVPVPLSTECLECV